jgi:hypothetical protein
MFILYAIPVGIVLGYLAGGRLERLNGIRLHWVPLILVGLAIQIVIFSELGGRLVGAAGPATYIASTAAVFVAVLRNLRIPGIAVVAVGAGCNLAAIAANGGWMPAEPTALVSVGGLAGGYTNSVVVANPPLHPLSDLFALPAWLPFANVFSVGDVLIGLGVVATIVLAMRRSTPAAPPGGGS